MKIVATGEQRPTETMINIRRPTRENNPDPRKVVKDSEARYFGGRLEEKPLVPLGETRLGDLIWSHGYATRGKGLDQAVAASCVRRCSLGWK